MTTTHGDIGRFAIIRSSLEVLASPWSTDGEIGESVSWVVDRLSIFGEESMRQAIQIIDDFWAKNSVPAKNRETIRRSVRFYGDCDHLCAKFTHYGFDRVVVIPDLMVFE